MAARKAKRPVRYKRPARGRQQPPPVQDRVNEGPPSRSGKGGTAPSSGSRNNNRRPLGVPEDYTAFGMPRRPEGFRGMSPRAVEGWTAAGQGPGAPRRAYPRYFQGDEWKPAQRGFDAIIAMQQALAISGYIEPDDEIAWGRWDKDTLGAYKRMLEEANASGLTEEQMLQQAAMSIRMDGSRGGGGGGGGRSGGGGGTGWAVDPETGEMVMTGEAVETFVPPPLQIETRNKQDLARVFRNVAMDVLGQGASPQEINEMVEAYNWMEIKLQKDAYDQEVARMRQEWDAGGVSGAGGTTNPAGITQQQITSLSAPSPETFIEDELRRRRPQEVAVNQGRNMLMDALDTWLGG